MKLIIENWKKYLEEQNPEVKEEETPEVDENLLNVAREAVQALVRTHTKITLSKSEEPRYEFDSFPKYFSHQEHDFQIFDDLFVNPDLLQKWRSLDDEGRERIREKVSNELRAFGETLQKIWDDPKLKEEYAKNLVRMTENSWVQAANIAETLV